MDRRYLRNIPAISEAEQVILAGKTVAVIGCGGLGGHLIELLCRVGVGSIRVVDGDVFEESNLNRQLLSTMATLDTSKAQAAAERVRAISPETAVTVCPVFLDEQNAAGSWRGPVKLPESPIFSEPSPAGSPRRRSPCPATGSWKSSSRRIPSWGTEVCSASPRPSVPRSRRPSV